MVIAFKNFLTAIINKIKYNDHFSSPPLRDHQCCFPFSNETERTGYRFPKEQNICMKGSMESGKRYRRINQKETQSANWLILQTGALIIGRLIAVTADSLLCRPTHCCNVRLIAVTDSLLYRPTHCCIGRLIAASADSLLHRLTHCCNVRLIEL